MPLVSSGVENGNLRELALQRMRDFGLTCRDVRNREVGLHEIHNKVRVRSLFLFFFLSLFLTAFYLSIAR